VAAVAWAAITAWNDQEPPDDRPTKSPELGEVDRARTTVPGTVRPRWRGRITHR